MITVGSDPEIFVSDNTGKIVSAHGMIEGDKRAPFPVDKGAVQVDGMALEFNIDPSKSEREFCEYIQNVMGQLRDMIPAQHELEITPIANFGSEYINAQPLAAKRLGCEPDYNAYSRRTNPKPSEESPFRTAAGHIHVGWGENMRGPRHRNECCPFIKQLDLFLGVPSVLMDDCTQRREMYGKAGAFRPKTYGAEYRVLSNFWLKSDALMAWAYRNTVKAVELTLAGEMLWEKYDNIEDVINNSDVEAAKAIIDAENLEVV